MKNYNKFRLAVLFILFTFSFAACKVYNDISSNYDKTVDFSKYKTFAWLPDKDTAKTEYNNQIIRNNTRNYFSRAMGDLGYKANLENPDVLLELVISENKKHTTVTSSNYPTASFPYYYQNNPYYYPYPNAYNYLNYNNYNYSNSYTTEKIEYTEGGITLNIIDRKENKLVWTGTAKGDLYDPDAIDANLHPAVYDLMKRYSDLIIKKEKKMKKKTLKV